MTPAFGACCEEAVLGGGGLRVTGVSASRGGVEVLTEVDLDIARGEVVALVGPNGAGKSSLLAVVSGDLEADAGTVAFDGTPLLAGPARAVARRRAVLLQENRLAFGFAAEDVVRMGRTPWHRTPSADRDEEVVAEAMAHADVTSLAPRLFPSLSGGERARVSFARVLAQEAPLLLLDEPTAALDIHHQERLLEMTRALAEAGCAVGVVLHDLSLAAAWADRICLLSRGRVVAAGAPGKVLTASLVEEVYGHPVSVIEHEGRPLVIPRRTSRPAPGSSPVDAGDQGDEQEAPCVPVS